MKNYLNFETDVKNLENELEKLKDPYNQEGLSEVDTKNISKVQNEIDDKLKEIYSNLNPWQTTQVARHEDRPKAKFFIDNLFEDSFFLDLEKINYAELNQEEKEKFLPSFFIAQILDVVSLEKLKFSKAEIAKTKLMRKWHFYLKNKNTSQLDELDRFKLHQELEMFLPSFIFYLPQILRSDWLNRWRDKDDKLFHPSNLLNGDEIKENLKIKDGPILGELLQYLSKELAYKRLNNFDEAIYKAKQWIEQNAPKCD